MIRIVASLACALALALAAPLQAQPAPDRFAALPAAVAPFVDQNEISGLR